MVTSIAEFVRYFEGVRRRTLAAAGRVTPEILDWAPWPGALDSGPKLDLETSRELLAATSACGGC